MSEPGGTEFADFDTPIGTCAVAWRGDRIAGTFLPAKSGRELERHVTARLPGAVRASPPSAIQALIERIRALLTAGQADFTNFDLDLDSFEPFERAVYAAAIEVKAGETRTYGEIAAAIGSPGAARAVGRALGRNPFPIVVPCHRILAAGGRSGGFTAPGGVATKFEMLRIERARRGGETLLFDDLPLELRR